MCAGISVVWNIGSIFVSSREHLRQLPDLIGARVWRDDHDDQLAGRDRDVVGTSEHRQDARREVLDHLVQIEPRRGFEPYVLEVVAVVTGVVCVAVSVPEHDGRLSGLGVEPHRPEDVGLTAPEGPIFEPVPVSFRQLDVEEQRRTDSHSLDHKLHLGGHLTSHRAVSATENPGQRHDRVSVRACSLDPCLGPAGGAVGD